MTTIEVIVVILSAHALAISILFWMLWRKQYDDMRSLAKHGLPAREVDECFQTLINICDAREKAWWETRNQQTEWTKQCLDQMVELLRLRKEYDELKAKSQP